MQVRIGFSCACWTSQCATLMGDGSEVSRESLLCSGRRGFLADILCGVVQSGCTPLRSSQTSDWLVVTDSGRCTSTSTKGGSSSGGKSGCLETGRLLVRYLGSA